ncbi:MAG TPA: glycoside hydrolase family 9 protein, partial [Chitinispirillaceae bacterium]|nr:glycoside hydrolase family 9 protein [Chitinispirillaceae bacterium]
MLLRRSICLQGIVGIKLTPLRIMDLPRFPITLLLPVWDYCGQLYRKYLDELCYDTSIGQKARNNNPKSLFEGGWFTEYDPVFYPGTANTGWETSHTHVLWGFFRLVLEDKALCSKLGLTDTQRLSLMEKTVYNLITNLAAVGKGTSVLQLPDADIWVPSNVTYDLPWFTMHTNMEWVWNHNQAGNIADMYYCYAIASRIQGLTLHYSPSSTDWKGDSLKIILVRMLDYMLGVNPWDISMIGGIGFKNLNHPHHRASNPELRNTLVEYDYRTLVGALIGGYPPTISVYAEHVANHMYSEVGIQSNATLLIPACGLSSTDREVHSRFTNLKQGIKNPHLRIIPRRQGTFFIISDKPFSSIEVFSLSGRLVTRSR